MQACGQSHGHLSLSYYLVTGVCCRGSDEIELCTAKELEEVRAHGHEPGIVDLLTGLGGIAATALMWVPFNSLMGRLSNGHKKHNTCLALPELIFALPVGKSGSSEASRTMLSRQRGVRQSWNCAASSCRQNTLPAPGPSSSKTQKHHCRAAMKTNNELAAKLAMTAAEAAHQVGAPVHSQEADQGALLTWHRSGVLADECNMHMS